MLAGPSCPQVVGRTPKRIQTKALWVLGCDAASVMGTTTLTLTDIVLSLRITRMLNVSDSDLRCDVD